MLTLNALSAALAHLLMGGAGWAGWSFIVLSRVAACAQDIRGGKSRLGGIEGESRGESR